MRGGAEAMGERSIISSDDLTSVGTGGEKPADSGSVTAFQILAVVLCWTINMLDGFDVLAIAFTAPEISADWGLQPAALGVVFSAGLFGMMAGALFLAPIGDYLGRRKTILAGLVIITLGMFVTAYVTTVSEMVAARGFTGLGIGLILASLTSITAEYAPARWRNLAITFMHAGYPVGAVLGGLVSVYLIRTDGWPAVFIFGAAASAVMIPLVYLCLPESAKFLLIRQPPGALDRVNAIRARQGHAALSSLPPRPAWPDRSRVSVLVLFSRDYLAATLALWTGFFMAMLALYFLVSWTPKVLSDAGLSPDQGRFAGVLMNLCGIFAMLLLGALSVRFGLRRVIQLLLGLSAVVIMVFAAVPLPAPVLLGLAFLMGLAMAGLVGFYAVAARLYPTEIRNTGVGWAIGIGRWGAVVGPLAAGWMIGAGFERWVYFLVLAAGPVLIAALSVGLIRAPGLESGTAGRPGTG